MRARSAGFTLVEALVALTIGGFVVLAAHQAFGIATESARRLATTRERHDVAMRARRFLSVTFANLDVAGENVVGFRGTPEAAAFSTLDHHEVLLDVAGERLRVRLDDSTVALMPAARVRFDYLLLTGADEAWVGSWQSPASAPVTVRVRLERPDGADGADGAAGAVDTLLFAIGSRG